MSLFKKMFFLRHVFINPVVGPLCWLHQNCVVDCIWCHLVKPFTFAGVQVSGECVLKDGSDQQKAPESQKPIILKHLIPPTGPERLFSPLVQSLSLCCSYGHLRARYLLSLQKYYKDTLQFPPNMLWSHAASKYTIMACSYSPPYIQ